MVVRVAEQGHLSLALRDWMKEEREKQESHREDPTRLSVDAVKAAGPTVGRMGQLGQEAEGREKERVAGYLHGRAPATHRGLCSGSDCSRVLE